MAAIKQLTLDGVRYSMYSKSIKAASLGRVFFFNRPVSRDDVEHLHQLVRLGMRLKTIEIRKVLSD